MDYYKWFKSKISYINDKLAEINGWFLMVLTILLLVNIVTRQIGIQIYGLLTLSIFLYIAGFYMGFPRCEEHKEHASVLIFHHLLPAKIGAVLDLIIEVLKIIGITLFLYANWGGFLHAYRTGAGIVEAVTLVLWPVRLAMVIGLVFFLIQTAINLLDIILDFSNYIEKKQEETENIKPTV